MTAQADARKPDPAAVGLARAYRLILTWPRRNEPDASPPTHPPRRIPRAEQPCQDRSEPKQ